MGAGKKAASQPHRSGQSQLSGELWIMLKFVDAYWPPKQRQALPIRFRISTNVIDKGVSENEIDVTLIFT